MMLSIVATMYRSAPYVEPFCARMRAAAASVAPDFEIVLVNDGSPDDALARASALAREDPRIVVVDLSRNFGHHAAIMAGLAQARGSRVYLTDIDLEEQPEWLPLFWTTLEAEGCDVVYGRQQTRIGSRAANIAAGLFWRLLNVGSTVRIPADQMTCRLMTRRYLDALLRVGDRVLYLGGVFPWIGFEHRPLALTKSPRPDRRPSSYGLRRKLGQAVDSLTSFTAAPLTLYFGLGLAIWAGSIVFGLSLLARKLIDPESVLSGFTSLMFSVWFLGGLIVLGIGLLGQYVAKIFAEVKDRPRYIVRGVIRGRGEHAEPS
jgi:putative glycosyltransferase